MSKKQLLCFVCGKPIVSKPGGIDHAKMSAIMGTKAAHLGCMPRIAAMVKQAHPRR